MLGPLALPRRRIPVRETTLSTLAAFGSTSELSQSLAAPPNPVLGDFEDVDRSTSRSARLGASVLEEPGLSAAMRWRLDTRAGRRDWSLQ